MNVRGDNRLSDRIRALKQRASESHSDSLSTQRSDIYGRVFGATRSEPQIIRLAKSLAAFLRKKELVLKEDDLLAGHQQFYDFSVPDEGTGWHLWPNLDEIQAGPEGTIALKQCNKGSRIGLYGFGPGGHVIAGYDRVLDRGFGAMAEAARLKLRDSEGLDREFASASLIVCEAATDYALRHAVRAHEMAREAAREERRSSLVRIGDACQWIARNPPRSFFEAVQLLWLTHEIVTCEQLSGSMSLGRLDQILYPYYAKDVAGGVLATAEAGELIEALWIKLGGLREGFQNVAVGGCGPDGECAVNDLSYLCVRASHKLKMDQPQLSVRWHPTLPVGFWNEVQGLIETGMGFPALFNDDVAIGAKHRLGIPLAHARNYGVVGCVELSVPGQEFSHTEGLRVNWAKVLELMLSGGVDTATGETMQLANRRELADIGSFQELYEWYKEELAHFIGLGIQGLNQVDRGYPKHSPYPFLSSTMEGCLEAGRDVTAGGTMYNLSSVNGCGMADTADSLVAIHRAVYQDNQLSLRQLAEILRNNFDGAEALRTMLASSCAKYGNDDDDPDGILRDLAKGVCRQVEAHRNPRGGRFQAGMYTVYSHGVLGRLTGALPSGRRRGVALANGLSPFQGADRSGPSAVVKSTTKLDHSQFGNGMVLDLKFHPSALSDVRGRQAFADLVRTYFRLGGLEVQFNVVGRETLLEAQASPEAYGDLLVRVSGFSAYFVGLPEVLQDEIIARTEHTFI